MANRETGGYAVNTLLSKNDYKINAQNADLTEFCKLLNEFFADMIKRGFIELKAVTPAMVESVAQFDAAPIIDVVQRAYTDEAAKIKYERAKLEFLKGKDNAANEIQEVIESLRNKYQREAVKYYKPREGGYWRLRYLQVESGFVTFDRALLIDDNTDKIQSKQHEEFVKKAHDLYTQILAFNKECKRLSGGAVGGIDYVMGGDALITINESGDCIFDASLTSLMRFDD